MALCADKEVRLIVTHIFLPVRSFGIFCSKINKIASFEKVNYMSVDPLSKILTTNQKALEVNLDDCIYGSFAEIGAGQEVARNFFKAGGAAGTIAKSMSAYDMTVSDIIYGKSGRYVSEDRVSTMLEREHELLCERLAEVRPDGTKFFVFADTVAAKSFRGGSDCHGWLGVRFQHETGAPASQIVIHIRMLDQTNFQQQDMLGVLGVNLVHACYFRLNNKTDLVEALIENIGQDRIEIDLIRVTGPAFDNIDSRLLSLELVKHKLCSAVLFDSKGKVLLAGDALYKKNILVCRGSYRPPTLVNLDMLKTGQEKFKDHLNKDEKDNILVLPEISMHKLLDRGEVDGEDFLARVDLINALGHEVLISSLEGYHQLNEYLASKNRKEVAFVLGFYNLEEIFNDENYSDEADGLLGAVGKLLGHRTSLYIYPSVDEKTKKNLHSKDAGVDSSMLKLIDYLKEKNRLQDIDKFNKDVHHIWSRTVLNMIIKDEKGWEDMVPKTVVEAVKENCLFGAKCEK